MATSIASDNTRPARLCGLSTAQGVANITTFVKSATHEMPNQIDPSRTCWNALTQNVTDCKPEILLRQTTCQPSRLEWTVTMAVRNIDRMNDNQPKVTINHASRFIVHTWFA